MRTIPTLNWEGMYLLDPKPIQVLDWAWGEIPIFYFEKIRVFKAGVYAAEYVSME